MAFFTNKRTQNFPWTHLQSEDELMAALEQTKQKPVLFFKHSTRCSISSMALHRFEQEWNATESKTELFFIDLLRFRAVSNLLTEISGVEHASPQVVVLFAGEVIYDASHSSIRSRDIIKMISNTHQTC